MDRIKRKEIEIFIYLSQSLIDEDNKSNRMVR